MSKDKTAQVIIRRKDIHTKRQLRSLIKWMKKTTQDLEDMEASYWQVIQKNYAPVFRYSLMR